MTMLEIASLPRCLHLPCNYPKENKNERERDGGLKEAKQTVDYTSIIPYIISYFIASSPTTVQSNSFMYSISHQKQKQYPLGIKICKGQEWLVSKLTGHNEGG